MQWFTLSKLIMDQLLKLVHYQSICSHLVVLFTKHRYLMQDKSIMWSHPYRKLKILYLDVLRKLENNT